MDEIYMITLNDDGEQVETRMTVDQLIGKWGEDVDIPTNDDTVVSCLLHGTQLYFETFGELMGVLTGNR